MKHKLTSLTSNSCDSRLLICELNMDQDPRGLPRRVRGSAICAVASALPRLPETYSILALEKLPTLLRRPRAARQNY